MTKKTLMRTAHKIASMIVDSVEDYMVALKLALKYVWRMVKKYNKKRFGAVALYNAEAILTTPRFFVEDKKYIDGVPTWLINENLSQQESYAVRNECDGIDIKRETEKAVLVDFATPYGSVSMWAPKSVCKFN